MLKAKEYTRKKRKDQSPELCIDDRHPISEKSSNESMKEIINLDIIYTV